MDHSRIVKKREQLIKVKLTEIFQKELALSALAKITITRVEMDNSMEQAKIFYLPFHGEDLKFKTQIAGRLSQIRRKLMHSMSIRKTPQLKFIFDKGLDHASKIDQILSQL